MKRRIHLEHVPALIRELGDQEACEIRLDENLQREDLDPLEEADGYRHLQMRWNYTVPQLAAKFQRSESSIYASLKLCELGEAGRAALLDGKLSASTALLVARIPDKDLQARAVKEIAQPTYGEPMSYRQAADHIHRNFMLQLKAAPFSLTDADLVKKARPCSTCPKRTGNQRELFSDVKSADVCTDPGCFEGKVEALWKLKVAQAEAEHRPVLPAKDAKKVFSHSQVLHSSGYVDLAGEEWVGDRAVSVKKLLGPEAAASSVLARAPDGSIHELVPRAVAEAAVKKIAPKTKLPRYAPGGADRERERKFKLRQAVVPVAIATLVAKAENNSKNAFLDFVAQAVLHHSFSDGIRRAVARRGLKKDKHAPDEILEKELARGLSDEGLRGWIVEVVAGDNATGNLLGNEYGARFREACKSFGVNLKALEADSTKALLPAKKKAAPAKKKKKAAKK